MGQRHQIYIKMPEKLGIAGFHHQWLYGMTAVKALARVVKFYKNQDKYGPLKNDLSYGLKRQSEVINALYSTDLDTGYWHFVHNLLDEDKDYAESDPDYIGPPEVRDPRNGDNNDGITIIDVSKGDFRYCFMSLNGLEGEIRDVPNLKPMTAREYLLCYYPKFLERLGSVDRDQTKETGKEKRRPINSEEFDPALHALLLIEEFTKVLTLPEVKKLFPEMYKKTKTEVERG